MYTAKQIADAIEAEANGWALFFDVVGRHDFDEALEGRKAVMRANVSVGYLEPLLPYLARLVRTSRMDKPQASGDWHDKPLRWIVNGPDSEVQQFSTKKDALLYARIRRGAASQQEAMNHYVFFD